MRKLLRNRYLGFISLYILLTIIIFIANSIIPFSGVDDLELGIPGAQSNSLFGYLSLVWNRNTRRLFCETGSWLSMHWEGKLVSNILNTFMMLALIEGLRRIFDLAEEACDLTFSLLNTVALFASVNYVIIGYSCFWVSGAVNYLWSSVALVWSIMCPVKLLLDQKIKAAEYMVFLLSTVAVSFSGEQFTVGAVAFTSLCFAIYLIYQKSIVHNNKLLFYIHLAILYLGSLISFLSPGFQDRCDTDIFYPGFSTLPIGIHIFRTYQWIINGIIHESTCLFASLLVLIAVVLWNKKKLKALISIAIAVILIIIKGLNILGFRLLNIGLPMLSVDVTTWSWMAPVEENVTWRLLSGIQQINMIICTILVVISIALLFEAVLLTDKKHFLLSVSIVLSGFITLIMMHFASSIYASGSRTFFAFNIFLIVVGRLLMNPFEKTNGIGNKKSRKVVVAAIVLAGINLMYSCGDVIHYILTRVV